MSTTNTGMRIAAHEIMIRMYNDEKDRLEERLNKVNEKIIFHTTTIMNLEKKKVTRYPAMNREA